MKRVNILIVDDEANICGLLTDFLEHDYECCTAHNVNEASRLLGIMRFDLAIVDILLPGESGLDLCEIIRSFYPSTRVIVVSAMEDLSYMLEAKRRGALSFTTKPFDLGYLSRLVSIALRHRVRPADEKANRRRSAIIKH